MATLTGKQLKDSYQGLLTIKTADDANPLSGRLENGLGNAITNLGIGTDSPDKELDVEGNIRARNTAGSSSAEIDIASGSAWRLRSNPTSGTNSYGLDIIKGSAGTDVKMSIDSGGDISFRDGSANQAFYWDASTARLGLGTTTPTSALTVHDDGSANSTTLVLANSYDVADVAGDSSALMFQLKRSYASGVNDAGFIKSVKEEAWDATSDRNSALTFGTRAGASEPTERMRIDSSGKVGIGETNPDRELDLKNSADNCVMSITSSASHLSGLVLGDTADDDRGGILYNNTSDYLYFLSNAQERLRIDSSGNVGIGTDDPSDRLEVKGATAKGVLVLSSGDTTITGNDVIGQINFKDYDADAHAGGNQNDLVSIKAIALHESGGATALDGSTGEGYALSFSTSLRPSPNALFTVSERMRIDSSGNVLVGTTANPLSGKLHSNASDTNFVLYTSGVSWASISNHTNSGTQFFQDFRYNGTQIGSILGSNTSTAFSTTSDYRLKENVVPMEGALDRVAQLKPSRFNFIADADTIVDGFLAHEVADIVPEAITGEKDATEEYEVTPAVFDDEGNVIEEAVMGTRPVYQGIDQSKLVPLLVGAIQELRAEIEQLKNQ